MRRLSSRSAFSSSFRSSPSVSLSSFALRSSSTSVRNWSTPVISSTSTTTRVTPPISLTLELKDYCSGCPVHSTSATTTPSNDEANLKPFEEVPSISMQEMWQLGGFTKLLSMSREIRRRYGDIVKFEVGGSYTVFVFHPDDMKTVMENEGKWPVGGAVTIWPLATIFNARGVKALGFSAGEQWKRLRTAFQRNIFPPLEAETYMPLVTPVTKEALREIHKHGEDMGAFLPRVTLEMIAAVLFGKSLGTLSGTAAPEDYEYINQVLKFFDVTESLMQRDPSTVKPEEIKPLDDAFVYLVDRGSYHLKTTMDKHAAGELKTPVAPYILKSANQPEVTPDEVAQNVIGLLIAGVDTTSNTLQWFLYNLARNPEAQERLSKEVRSVLKGRHLTKEDLTELPFLKASLKETFRITPTAPGTARILSDSIALRGYKMPPGVMYLLNPFPWAMDDNVFENASAFNPDRYDRKLKGERSKTNPYHDSPYLNMPFSRGPRMCIGSRLAELEILSFMAAFAQEYKIEFLPNSPVPEAISKLTIRPEPSPTYKITRRD